MKKVLLFDLGAVLLFPADKTITGKLNPIHEKLSQDPNYNFFDHFELNTELLSFLKTLKEKYDFYMITEGSIQNAPEIRSQLDEVFSHIYSARETGISKKSPEAYINITKELDIQPSEIKFIDDSEANLETAKKAGLTTLLYESNHQIINELKPLSGLEIKH